MENLLDNYLSGQNWERVHLALFNKDLWPLAIEDLGNESLYIRFHTRKRNIDIGTMTKQWELNSKPDVISIIDQIDQEGFHSDIIYNNRFICVMLKEKELPDKIQLRMSITLEDVIFEVSFEEIIKLIKEGVFKLLLKK